MGWFYAQWCIRVTIGRLSLRTQSWNPFTYDFSLRRKGTPNFYNGVRTSNELWFRLGWFALSYWWL